MLNQFYVVGRIKGNISKKEYEDGTVKGSMYIEVQRSYKNEDGVYETDKYRIEMRDGIASNVSEYCTDGDLVGIKGRLQSDKSKVELIAEKVSFLASKSKVKENENVKIDDVM